MKVAFFTQDSNLTGANRSLIDLIGSLKLKGVVSIVFLPRNGSIEQELNNLGILYYILPYKLWYHNTYVKKTLKMKAKNILKERYNASLAKKAAKILKDEDIDIIHSNSLMTGFGGEVAKTAGLPHVWHIREFMEEDHHLEFFNEKKATRLIKNATALVAISDVVASKYSKKYNRDVVTIYNGINIEKYSIPDKRIFQGSITELMIAGRIVASKGQMEAVKAVELLKAKNYNIHLRIIGDGNKDGELEKILDYIKMHNLEDVVEHVPFQEDLMPFSETCDIQLVCSHSEAFGRVTIEGMLAHSLVIGADAGCTPYLIKDRETGLLYVCKDPKALSEKIEWAINNKEKAQKIAEEGYVWGGSFSIEVTAEKVLKLYQRIMETA